MVGEAFGNKKLLTIIMSVHDGKVVLNFFQHFNFNVSVNYEKTLYELQETWKL